MAFNRSGAQVKLDAIKNKDVDQIVQDQPYIPGLGQGYTKAQLLNWAKPKVDLLQSLMDAPDAQARFNILVPVYQSMTPTGQTMVKSILNDEQVDFDDSNSEYFKLVLARLVHFADPDMRVP